MNNTTTDKYQEELDALEDLEELVVLIGEYLKYLSSDGRPERQPLRRRMAVLIERLGPQPIANALKKVEVEARLEGWNARGMAAVKDYEAMANDFADEWDQFHKGWQRAVGCAIDKATDLPYDQDAIRALLSDLGRDLGTAAAPVDEGEPA